MKPLILLIFMTLLFPIPLMAESSIRVPPLKPDLEYPKGEELYFKGEEHNFSKNFKLLKSYDEILIKHYFNDFCQKNFYSGFYFNRCRSYIKPLIEIWDAANQCYQDSDVSSGVVWQLHNRVISANFSFYFNQSSKGLIQEAEINITDIENKQFLQCIERLKYLNSNPQVPIFLGKSKDRRTANAYWMELGLTLRKDVLRTTCSKER